VARTSSQPKISPRDLQRWRLIKGFRKTLRRVAKKYRLHPTFSDPDRSLNYDDYLCLFLFGLLNPVVRTMRGMCEASHLPRVQASVCTHPVSLGSFSATQHLVDVGLLEGVFSDLSQEVSGKATSQDQRLNRRPWSAHDGSLFPALPRMAWALYGGGRNGDGHAVKLHLSFHLLDDKPLKATIRPGQECERAVWQEHWQEGAAFVGDRYFGEDYRLLTKLKLQGCAYVVRLREQATINVEEELAVTEADRKAGVVRQVQARLGATWRTLSVPVRVVWVKAEGRELILITNLSAEELPAELVSELYRKRWQVELFFRWIKCILGCRHWLAESPQGVAIQIYLALIAALLLQLYTGQRPTRRMMELIQFYLLGVATLSDLMAGLEREFQRLASKNKKRV